MAGPMEREYHVQYPSLVATVITFIAGLMAHSFIIAVNVTEWLKRRPVTAVDQILTSLGVTRTCLLFLLLLDMVSFIFLRNLMNLPTQLFIYLTEHSSNLTDIWLTTLFSVVFCLKISNFDNALFLRLKIVVSRRVVPLILASVLVSILFISMFCFIDHKIMSNNPVQNTTMNNTHLPEIIHVYIFMAMGNSVPFLIYCTSSILLITSLCLHLRRMRCNKNVTTNLEAYYKAIKFMTFCLICFMLRIGSNLLALHFYLQIDFVWIFTILNSLPILHSIYLICRTNKLKDHASRILRHGTNCLFNKRGPEIGSRGPVEQNRSMRSN
ncbi:taste receptor type 2 member 4-like [Pseudophryne corroboree]|uniref:taste receptor type 2 member 4-like n=1 Tax=Pseudophryne corroboree TaxID=495146 RepID=UPI003081212E